MRFKAQELQGRPCSQHPNDKQTDQASSRRTNGEAQRSGAHGSDHGCSAGWLLSSHGKRRRARNRVLVASVGETLMPAYLCCDAVRFLGSSRAGSICFRPGSASLASATLASAILAMASARSNGEETPGFEELTRLEAQFDQTDLELSMLPRCRALLWADPWRASQASRRSERAAVRGSCRRDREDPVFLGYRL